MAAKIKEKEKDVQRAILNYLELTGAFYYRQNTGAVAPKINGKQYFFRYGTKGAPDIVIVENGTYIGVEVKGTGGKQSDDQIDFERRLINAGGKYILAHNLDDFLDEFAAKKSKKS